MTTQNSATVVQLPSWITDKVSEIRARNQRWPGWSMEADPEPAPTSDSDPKKDPEPDPKKDPDPDRYPANTRPEDMKPEERAAFFEEKARKQENRNKDLLRVTGGKYGKDLQADMAELEELRKGRRSEAENAVEEAKTQTRAEVRQEFGTKLVAAKFEAALAHVDDDRRDKIIEGLALSNYLTEDGEVDTAKVKDFASTIAPSDKEQGNGRRDYGAGRRGGQGGRSKSVASVQEERRAAREAKAKQQ